MIFPFLLNYLKNFLHYIHVQYIWFESNSITGNMMRTYFNRQEVMIFCDFKPPNRAFTIAKFLKWKVTMTTLPGLPPFSTLLSAGSTPYIYNNESKQNITREMK